MAEDRSQANFKSIVGRREGVDTPDAATIRADHGHAHGPHAAPRRGAREQPVQPAQLGDPVAGQLEPAGVAAAPHQPPEPASRAEPALQEPEDADEAPL